MQITIEPMFGAFLGIWEILIILMVMAVGLVVMGTIVAVIVVLLKRRNQNPPPPPSHVGKPPVVTRTGVISGKCPQCGTPLPAGALAGLCPTCLLKAGAAADTITDAKQPGFNPPSAAELAPLFPQLEILELIGKGGMGAVYKARQKQLDRVVALKILPPGIGADPAFAERFAREAKALAKLNHPGIVTLYEFGDAGGQFYFLMEFVDGVNLRQLLNAGRVSPREALAIVPQICDALQFAHDQGIVHRDIKPENILLDRRGRVKVADFGLAKIVGNDAPLTPSLSPSDGERVAKPGEGSPVLTDAGKTMGTPQYMSPEQITAPGEVDHRADIYALGVVFYQMLTGELPAENIEPPSSKVQIDARLDEVVLRALEKKPELRYQQVSQVKTCVETIVSTPGSSGSLPRQSEATAGEEAQTEKSEIGNRKSGIAPRFSRTAIAGACWTTFVVVGLVPLFIALKPVSVPAGSPPVGVSWLVLLIGLPLALLGLTAPFITTIFGWVAVSQIRRSAGKLYGMWLAVFDGLLFPLLAVDAVLLAVCMITADAITGTDSPENRARAACILGWVLLSLMIDWLIIRAVWRAVNKGPVMPPAISGNSPDVKPPSVTSSNKNPWSAGNSLFWPVLAAGLHGVMFLGVTVFLATIVSHFTAIFAGLHARLPVTTQLVFSLSNFVQHGGYQLIPVVLVLDVVICWLLHKFVGRMVFIAWAVAVALASVLLVVLSMVVIGFTVSNLGNYVGDAAANAPAPISAQAASNPAFGPVMEWVLPNNAAIDVGSGQMKTVPETLTRQRSSNEKDAAVCSWLEQAHADFAFLADDGIYGMTRDMTTLKRDQWDSYNPENFAGSLHDLGRNVASKFGHAEPLNGETNYTYAFKTSAGQFGLLQITGYTENPRGVKIRYKLVQPGLQPFPAAKEPTQSVRAPYEKLRWLLEEKPPLAEAKLELNATPLFPLATEAAGWAESDGQFNPVMYLAKPFPRGGAENYLDVHTNGESERLNVYRGTNPLAIANRFLGSYEITRQPADANFFAGFALSPTGQLFLEIWTEQKGVTLTGQRTRPPDPVDKPTGIIRRMSSPVIQPDVSRSFGPVMERVVYDQKLRVGSCIDFESGRLVTIPPDTQSTNISWVAKNGIDAFCEISKEFKGLRSTGGLIAQFVQRESWDTKSPAEIVEAMGHYEPELAATPSFNMGGVGEQLPATYIFRTIEGHFGILQITGFSVISDTNGPTQNGVKIRYKLVQAAGTPPNPAATATPPAPMTVLVAPTALTPFASMTALDAPTALTPPASMTALDALQVARPVANAFAALSAALDRGDLPLAQSLATSLVADVESYNRSVQGTAYEYSQSVRDALALCLDALKARDLPLARSRLAAIYALLNSSSRPPAAQNPSARPAVSSSADLKARLDAASSITSFTEQDKALAAIVRDAAKAGEAAVAKQALAKMTSFTAQDQAALEAARELVKAGRRTDAIDIARSMTSFTLRDAALKELAQ